MEERFRFVKEFGGEVEPSLASVCRRYRVHEVLYGTHCLGYFLERDKQPRLRPERPESVPAATAPDLGGSVCATEPPILRETSSVSGEEAAGL